MLFSHLKVTIHAQGQAPRAKTLRYVTRGKFTLPAPPENQTGNPEKPETLGSSDSLTTPSPCARGPAQNRRKSKTYSQCQRTNPRILRRGVNRSFKENPNGCIPFNRFSGGRSPKPYLLLSAFAIHLLPEG